MLKINLLLLLLSGIVFGMPKGHQNSIGLGVAYIKNPYIESNDRMIPMGNINYRYKMFYIKGKELGLSLNRNFSFFLTPEFGKYEIDGIEKREDTIEIGAKYSYRLKGFKTTLSYQHDGADIHNGNSSSLQLSRSFISYPWIIIPNISLKSDDKNKANYYYGVENSSKYEDYKLNRTYDYGAGMVLIYNINEKWGLQGIYKKILLDKQKYDSPLVKDRTKTFYFGGISYKF